MSNFGDISVELRVKARTEELKRAIADFREGKISVEDLRKATDDLKGSINDQSQAISTLRRTYRTQNFEFLEAIRVMRSVGSFARDLNQIWQTSILRGIEQKQTAIAQREAFEDLEGQLTKVTNALEIFGASEEVKKAFKEIAADAKNISETDIEKMVGQVDSLLTTVTDPEKRQALIDFRDRLLEIKEIKLEENQAKQWEDYFQKFVIASVAAGHIATLISKIKELKALTPPTTGGGTGTTPGGTPKGGGLLGLFLSIFGPSIADTILTALGDKDAAAREQQRQLEGQAFQEFVGGKTPTVGLDESGRLVPVNQTSIKVDINNPIISSDADITRIGEEIAKAINRKNGQVVQ